MYVNRKSEKSSCFAVRGATNERIRQAIDYTLLQVQDSAVYTLSIIHKRPDLVELRCGSSISGSTARRTHRHAILQKIEVEPQIVVEIPYLHLNIGLYWLGMPSTRTGINGLLYSVCTPWPRLLFAGIYLSYGV